jgi:hypothetical protein
MKRYQVCILVLIVVTMASPCFAQSPKDKFVGTWRLVGYEDPEPYLGRDTKDPVGIIMYDSTGHMAGQINRRSDRPKFKAGTAIEGTPEEIKAAFVNYTAYYGTYEVNEKEGIVIHHLEASLFPNEIGADNVRYYDLSPDGNRLIYTVPRMVKGKRSPKSESPRRLIWERVK